MAPPGWAGGGSQGARYQTAPRYPPAAALSVARVLYWPLSLRLLSGQSRSPFGGVGVGERLGAWRFATKVHSLPTASRRFCVHKPCPPERHFSLQSLKHAPDSLSCPLRKKHKLGTMTTTPKHLYPFIQHSVNVYCEPDITSGCVPAVPDLTVMHTRMFLECCFSALVISGVPLISRREPLGQDEVQLLTNVAHTWPSTTCPCSLFHCSPPFLCSSRTPLVSASSTSRLHLPWSSLPDELSLVPYLRFQGHFP